MDRILSSGIDRLRAYSILGVVCIHATSPLINQHAPDPSHDLLFWWAVLINQASRFSVPAFFFLAGLLTGTSAKDRMAGPAGVRGYLKSRLLRLVLPYLAWSLIFWIRPIWQSRHELPADFSQSLLLGQTFVGGYFLVALAQLTLCAPFLCRWAILRARNTATMALIFLTLIIAGVMIGVYGMGPGIAPIIRQGFSVMQSTGVVWAPFFILGIVGGLDPGSLRATLRQLRPWLLPLAIISLPLSILEFRAILAVGGTAGLAVTFLKPSSIALACAVTGLVLGREDATAPSRLVALLAPASFAVYLVHGGVLQILSRFAPGPGAPGLVVAAGIVMTATAALVTALVFHRVVATRLPSPFRLVLIGKG
jgi:surface polysaccharide O-acyltransferase-like enzyme